MSHTYTKLNVHVVFSTWDRTPLISARIESRLHAYLGGIIGESSAVPIAINGVEDHVHILARLRPTIALSDLMETLKANSSRWVNETFEMRRKFRWQGGYSAFSVSESVVPSVVRYIQRQKEHHRARTFEDEFRELLQVSGLDPARLPGQP